jgi:flagella basal body P-ring formation protein FlgA
MLHTLTLLLLCQTPETGTPLHNSASPREAIAGGTASGILLSAAPTLPGSPAAAVELQPTVSVRGTRVLLSDVAKITCTDEKIAAKLSRIDLGPRPDGNWQRTIEAAEVRRQLASLALPEGAVVLSGVPRSAVKSEHLTLRGADLVASADAALRKRLREEGEAEAEVESVSPPIDRQVPPGRSRLELAPQIAPERMSRGGALVDVAIKVDGETHPTVPVSFRVRRFREAIAARIPIAAGEAFTRDNVELRRAEITQLAFTPVSDESLLFGKVAVRNLRAGQPVTAQDFREAPLVRRGEIVTLRARSGRVEITTKGIAQSDGAREALIPVLNVSSQKIVFARVERTGLVGVP